MDISAVVVNEGLDGCEMRHYLAVIKQGGRGIAVLFDVSRRPAS